MNLLAVQGTLKSLLQYHSSKASILQHSAIFIVQLSHPYMTTGKTIALSRQTFVGKVMQGRGKIWVCLSFPPQIKPGSDVWVYSPQTLMPRPTDSKSALLSLSPAPSLEISVKGTLFPASIREGAKGGGGKKCRNLISDADPLRNICEASLG